MTILLDTNIIMDAVQERQPFDLMAKEILSLGQQGVIQCYFTANAAADIFFLYSKIRGKQTARRSLRFLMETYEVISVTKEDCQKAIELSNDDFEDALVEVCADKINADYIVSRDVRFRAVATAGKVIPPDELLSIIKQSGS